MLKSLNLRCVSLQAYCRPSPLVYLDSGFRPTAALIIQAKHHIRIACARSPQIAKTYRLCWERPIINSLRKRKRECLRDQRKRWDNDRKFSVESQRLAHQRNYSSVNSHIPPYRSSFYSHAVHVKSARIDQAVTNYLSRKQGHLYTISGVLFYFTLVCINVWFEHLNWPHLFGFTS